MKTRYLVKGIAYVPFTIEVNADDDFDAFEIVEGMTFDEIQHRGILDLGEESESEFEVEPESATTVKECQHGKAIHGDW